jgi:FkbM family methyltransferase
MPEGGDQTLRSDTEALTVGTQEDEAFERTSDAIRRQKVPQTTYITEVETPHGNPARFKCRTDTSDLATVGASNRLWGNLVDEYHIPTGLSGWALDVGAHIGSVTVPLLLDNPDLRVMAIEAVPPNRDLLRENLELNGVLDRCAIAYGAAWDDSTDTIDVEYGYTGSEVAETHAYIGSVTPWMDAPGEKQSATVATFTLDDVLGVTGGDGFVWVKTDCEGCEHRFFKGPGLAKIGIIEGEWHERDGTPESFAEQLSKTHTVTWEQGIGGGPFRAVPRA